MREHSSIPSPTLKPTPSGVARQQVTFLVLPRKVTKRGRPRFAAPSGFPALLDWSGLLINSHDPLRGHVLKHIRQNSLTSFRYSAAHRGEESQNSKPQRGHFVPTLLTLQMQLVPVLHSRTFWRYWMDVSLADIEFLGTYVKRLDANLCCGTKVRLSFEIAIVKQLCLCRKEKKVELSSSGAIVSRVLA